MTNIIKRVQLLSSAHNEAAKENKMISYKLNNEGRRQIEIWVLNTLSASYGNNISSQTMRQFEEQVQKNKDAGNGGLLEIGGYDTNTGKPESTTFDGMCFDVDNEYLKKSLPMLKAAKSAMRTYIAATFDDKGQSNKDAYSRLDDCALAIHSFAEHQDKSRFAADILDILS